MVFRQRWRASGTRMDRGLFLFLLSSVSSSLFPPHPRSTVSTELLCNWCQTHCSGIDDHWSWVWGWGPQSCHRRRLHPHCVQVITESPHKLLYNAQDRWNRSRDLSAARNGWQFHSLVFACKENLILEKSLSGCWQVLNTVLQPFALQSRAMMSGWATSEGTMRAGATQFEVWSGCFISQGAQDLRSWQWWRVLAVRPGRDVEIWLAVSTQLCAANHEQEEGSDLDSSQVYQIISHRFFTWAILWAQRRTWRWTQWTPPGQTRSSWPSSWRLWLLLHTWGVL